MDLLLMSYAVVTCQINIRAEMRASYFWSNEDTEFCLSVKKDEISLEV